MGPTVRHAFEVGNPENLLNQLKKITKNKEVEIEDLCKLHYEDFIVAVDELRGILLDADELKQTLSSENSRLQDVGSSLLIKLDELLELVHCSVLVIQSGKYIQQTVNLLLISLLVLMPQLLQALSTSSESNDLPHSSLRASHASEALRPSSLSPSPL